jgi:hypothetical protein
MRQTQITLLKIVYGGTYGNDGGQIKAASFASGVFVSATDLRGELEDQ